MNKYVNIGAIALGGFVIGGLTGYGVANMRLRKQYEALVEIEIDNVKEMYRRRHKEAQYATPESAAAELFRDDEAPLGIVPMPSEPIEALVGEIAEKIMENPIVEQLQTRNAFDTSRQDELDEVMSRPRSEDFPYVITVDEFQTERPEFDKTTITYYELDDTLCDDREVIVPDVDGTVGIEHLNQFGIGSQDDHIVYIRNERVATDFEVVLNKGYYAVEVLNMDLADVEPPAPMRRRPKKSSRDAQDD